MKVTEIIAAIEPRVRRWIQDAIKNIGTPAPSTGAMEVHEIDGSFHQGTIGDHQAPQFLKVDGSRTLEDDMPVASGKKVDGVDISELGDNFSTLSSDFAAHDSATAVAAHGTVGAHDHTTTANGGDLTQYAHADGSGVRNAYQAVRLARTITAGNGLTGGGTLTGDIGFDVGAGTGIDVAANSVGVDLTTNFAWTGEHTHNATTNFQHVLPIATDTYDVGSTTKIWNRGYFSELNAFVFAENTIFPIGGWLIICKFQGSIVGGTTSSATSVDLGVSGMAVNDFIVLRSVGQVEYMKITAYAGSGSVYTVARGQNSGGTGVAWAAGSVWANFGYNGSGRIELNANDSPRIQLMRQLTTYGASDEVLRIGDLNGNWGYATETPGIAVGVYGAGKPNLTVDSTALRLRNHTTDIIKLDNTGANIVGDLTVTSPGQIIAGNGNVVVSQSGLVLKPYMIGTPDDAAKIRWIGSGIEFAAIYGSFQFTNYNALMLHGKGDGSSLLGMIRMRAFNANNSASYGIDINGNDSIDYMATTQSFTGNVSVSGTTSLNRLAVNQGGSPSAGEIRATFLNLNTTGAASGELKTSGQANINGLIWLGAGTSFPTPVTNGCYLRTDRSLLYFHDGTNWLTVQEYEMSVPDVRFPSGELNSTNITGTSAGTEHTVWVLPLHGSYKMAGVKMWFYLNKAGTHDGSNRFNVSVKTFDYSSNAISLCAWTTDARSTRFEETYGSVLNTDGTSGTAPNRVTLRVYKTGTPGLINLAFFMKYRLVG